MISAARNEIIDQMTTADLDEVANRILSKASNSFLDKALEMRLNTIEAKHLINALARAERLGYEPSDVQDDGDLPEGAPLPTNGNTNTSPPNTLPRNAVPSQPAPPSPAPGLPPHCNLCFRRFFKDSAYEYHMRHQVCTRVPPAAGGFTYSCEHCGQGFTTIAGLNYVSASPMWSVPSICTAWLTFLTAHNEQLVPWLRLATRGSIFKVSCPP